jgi:hypothetical protein
MHPLSQAHQSSVVCSGSLPCHGTCLRLLRPPDVNVHEVPHLQVASAFCVNSGLTSTVLCTWFISAAHRSCIAPLCVPLASCTRFWLKRSFSTFSSFSLRFIAPGRDLRLLRWILACPTSTSPLVSVSSMLVSASASDSRFATSFLLGRRRFWIWEEDFSILEINAECLIFRLSLLDTRTGASAVSAASDSVGVAVERTARATRARAVVRFLIGA